jgi:urease accessory protein
MQVAADTHPIRRPRAASKTRLRHDGGGPCNSPHLFGQVSWMPAFAGMTFALALGGAASSAVAHTGAEHAASFASGFAHPWSGLDHLLAMVAVGLWAGLVGGRALWTWPAAFVAVMLAGGLVGVAGVPLPMVEPGILASVIVLGLLVLMAARLPVWVGALLVALFAVLHGHAHVAGLPAAGAAASYCVGFALATAALHALGLGIAYVASGNRGRLIVRGAGAAVATAGIALAVVA